MPALYHFTHAANIQRILADEALLANRLAHTARDIGDSDIKRARRSCFVQCGPGGVIADYVPFYFAPRSPMLYRLHAAGRNGPNGSGQRPLVYLVTTIERVTSSGGGFVFTNANARAQRTLFCDDISQLDEYVDWELMGAEYWNDTVEQPDRKSRRQAEFLVFERLPVDRLGRIGVIDERVAGVMRHLLDHAGFDIRVDVTPDWYFGA